MSKKVHDKCDQNLQPGKNIEFDFTNVKTYAKIIKFSN